LAKGQRCLEGSHLLHAGTRKEGGRLLSQIQIRRTPEQHQTGARAIEMKDSALDHAELWPTREQMLVLRAALMPREQALPAFGEWLGLIDLDGDFDQGTFRLLPLMYDNLRKCGVSHPLMSRLKGVYRLSWYKNNKLFNNLRPVMEAFHGAGIPTMLLKGVPLVHQYYKNIALRPMADIDVLVPADRDGEALELMTRFAYSRMALLTPDYLQYRHAMGYWSADHGEIDIHWHALFECCEAGADDFFWNSSQPIDFSGVPSLMPDATRMLLHTLIHGFRWNAEPPIRWIPDAMTILHNAPAGIDWDAMVDYAHANQLEYRLRHPLAFLKRHFDAAVPDAVMARLAQNKISLIQRIENSCVLRDPRRLHGSPMGHLWIVFADYCRFARNAKPIAFAIGFTHYLRFRWQLRGRSEIPAYIGRGLLKRVRRWFLPAGQGTTTESPDFHSTPFGES
jgi:Uncharacterised nucleotidyltransferase